MGVFNACSMSGVFSLPDQTHRDEASVPWAHAACWRSLLLWGLSVLLLRWMCLKRQRFCRWPFPLRSPRSLSSSSQPSYTADPCRRWFPWRRSSPQSHTDTCRRFNNTDYHVTWCWSTVSDGKTMVNLSSLHL